MNFKIDDEQEYAELARALKQLGAFRQFAYRLPIPFVLPAANPAVETMAAHMHFPAGELNIGDVLVFTAIIGKTLGAASHTTRLRMGPLHTTSDPVLLTAAPAGGSLSFGYRVEFLITSNTTIRQRGNASVTTPYGGANAGSLPANVTIADITAAENHFHLWVLNGNTTDDCTVREFTVEVIHTP